MELGSYESYLNISVGNDGSSVGVTCTQLQIQDGTIHYEVDQISLCDAEQKQVAALDNKPTLGMVVPEQQLKDVVVNVLSIDERVFSEISTNPGLALDWCVLVETFH